MSIVEAIIARDSAIERNDPEWAAWDWYVSHLLEEDAKAFSF